MRAGIARAVVLAAVGMGSALAGGFASDAQTPPSGCTSIADVPPQYSGIQYGAAIVGIFTNFTGTGVGCDMCHTTNEGTTSPSGGLDLDPGDTPSPWVNLINVQSAWYPGYVYVVPNHPEQSLLFMKVDCQDPGVGSRMPLIMDVELTPDQIATIYDWIAEGAPVDTTDGIFRGTFDVRGFAQ